MYNTLPRGNVIVLSGEFLIVIVMVTLYQHAILAHYNREV